MRLEAGFQKGRKEKKDAWATVDGKLKLVLGLHPVSFLFLLPSLITSSPELSCHPIAEVPLGPSLPHFPSKLFGMIKYQLALYHPHDQ